MAVDKMLRTSREGLLLGKRAAWGRGRPPLPPSMLPQGAGLQSRLGLMEYAGESERGHSRGSTGEGGGRSFRGTGVRGRDGGKGAGPG